MKFAWKRFWDWATLQCAMLNMREREFWRNTWARVHVCDGLIALWFFGWCSLTWLEWHGVIQ
jgi:hypothetical protein